MPGPVTKVLQQPTTITSATAWTVSAVRAALSEHEDGQFQRSGRLARDFGRDDRIAPCIGDRINALVGAGAADFELTPVEGKFASRSKAAIKRLTWWDDVVTSAWRRKNLYDIVTMGFSLSFVPWARTSSEWRPLTPIHWEAENVYWSEQDQRYVAQTLSGPVLVDPEDPNWFLCTPGGDRSWMCGGVRGLAMPFLFRGWDLRDWARYNERHGLPIIAVREPVGMGEGAAAEAFYEGVRNMGSSGIVRTPQGETEQKSFGFDLVEAKSRSFDSFDKFIDRLNVAVAIYIKGQNLTTEVQGGAYASTGWHMRVRADYAQNDADALSEAERVLIQHWGRFNIAGWQDEFAPWPTWDLDLPEDQGARATALKTGVETLEKAEKLTTPVDLEVLAEDLGMPLVKGAPIPDPEDRKPEPPPDGAGEDDQPPAPKAKAHRLRSGARAAANKGFIDGQLFVDALVEEATLRGEAALRPTLDAVLEELEAATDYDDLRSRLRARYTKLSSTDLSDLCAKALVLAELAGSAAVIQDV